MKSKRWTRHATRICLVTCLLVTGAVAAEKPARAKEEPQVAAAPDPKDAQQHRAVSAKVFLSNNRLSAGGSTRVAVVVDVSRGYHIRAHEGPAQLATAVQLSNPQLKWTPDKYPAGKTMTLEGEKSQVYEKQVIITGTIVVPANVLAPQELDFSLHYQACHVKTGCEVPTDLKMTGTLSVAKQGEAVDSANTDLFEGLAVR